MTPLLFVGIVVVVSFAAGFLGALLGLGGGLIVVPVLTLLLHVDIRLAIGASIISVIATSSGAAAAYVKEHLANIRVAMFLELGTASGAIVGAYLAGLVHPRWLYILFGAMLGYSAVAMLRGIHAAVSDEPPGALSDWLRLNGSYFDHATGEQVEYPVRRPLLGLGMMFGAGTVSGLLGVGSGALKVPAMDLGMGLPMRVSTATSNLTDYFSSRPALGELTNSREIYANTIGAVLRGVRGLRGQSMAMLGILLLILTPVVRVAISVVLFAERHDRRYVLITTVVLALLLTSLISGLGE